MTIKDIVESESKWSRPPPAQEDAISKLVESSGLTLPTSYIEFFHLCNGGEGELPVQPLWFQLWPAEDVIQRNQDYSINKFIPGFFGIGSNGGGELLAFDAKGDVPWPVVAIPSIPMDAEDAVEVAPSFMEFAGMFGVEE